MKDNKPKMNNYTK